MSYPGSAKLAAYELIHFRADQLSNTTRPPFTHLFFVETILDHFQRDFASKEKQMAAFTVTLSGGAPWGFSMAGGVDFNQPLNVSKVTTGGKAALKGIRPGLCILQVKIRYRFWCTWYTMQPLVRASSIKHVINHRSVSLLSTR